MNFPLQKSNWNLNDWCNLCFLLICAAILRVIFFNGFFGSDDAVYLGRSLEIANNVWTSANYNGSLRYGYNIPAGFFIWMFGLNVFTANLWSLLCSLIEVIAVYYFATTYIGKRAGVFAGLIAATLPLHVALATRTVIACFLTLSFVLLASAEQHRKVSLYFLAGLAMGMVFWVKELAAVTLFAFMTYPLFARRFDVKWFWIVAGGVTMLVAHLTLMFIIAGDPLHLFKTVLGQISTNFIAAEIGEDGPFYYFRYLFGDIKHTWIIAYFALAAASWRLWPGTKKQFRCRSAIGSRMSQSRNHVRTRSIVHE
jgi:4-amino-4-deoxy-L-arabinose transferase-like glycosyltransferase